MKYAEFLKMTKFSKNELLAMAWGNLVEDPPADGMVALPAPPMLMLDRVLNVHHDGHRGRIEAEQDIHLDSWFFQCHFRTDPVQPGCLGVDAIWQMIGIYLGLRGAKGAGRALGAKEIDFFGQIRPFNKVVRYEVDISRFTELSASNAALAIGTGHVFVDGEHIYTVKDAKVGAFNGIRYPDFPFKSQNSIGGRLQR